jgi:23S rRNA (adenine2503-C2)-methyltransferase
VSDLSGRIFESVPNVCTADPRIVRELAGTLRGTPGLRLIHASADAVHGRSIFTVLGERQPLLDGLVALAQRCNELIDLTGHEGLHPKVGALDVVPIVALHPAAEPEGAVAPARELMQRLGAEAGLWCAPYDAASSEGLSLPVLRQGGTARLFRRIEAGEVEAVAPEGDDERRRLTRGVTCVGARRVLVDVRVELATGELRLARRIAGLLRGETGGLPAVRALSFRLGPDRAQIAMNLVDHRVTDVATAHAWIVRLAEEAGVEVARTELVGCVPRAAWPRGLGERIGQPVLSGDAEDRRVLESWLPGGPLADDPGLDPGELPEAPPEEEAAAVDANEPAARLRLLDFGPAEAEERLAGLIESLGERPYRASQVLNGIWKRRCRSFAEMTDLPRALRERLEGRVEIGLLEISERVESSDGTVKYLWRCQDGSEVESVSIPTVRRTTFCLSSQVGCSLKCKFCATGYLGFGRNLSPGEIVDQALGMLADQGLSAESLNLVFMGQGEPGHNTKSVLQALRSFNDAAGLGVGARRITVSTSGVVPAMEELAAEPIQFRLALSLHAADQALRESLMNIAEKHPLDQLQDACRAYCDATRRRITLEYCLIPGVTDGDWNARKLSVWGSAFPSKVNLIPYNPVEEFNTEPATTQTCTRFREQVLAAGYRGDVMIRETRGRDIEAACGMLHRHRGGQAADSGA